MEQVRISYSILERTSGAIIYDYVTPADAIKKMNELNRASGYREYTWSKVVG